MNLFENKRIRTCFDSTSNKRWFSVIDIIAVLTDSDYQKARNYWKWLKTKLERLCSQPVSTTNQLKMEAADGKLRRTDVMDAAEVLQLIQLCPSPKAEAFKLWLAELVSEGKDAAKCLCEAVSKLRYRVGNMLFIVRKKEFNIFGAEETCAEKFNKGHVKGNVLQNGLEAA